VEVNFLSADGKDTDSAIELMNVVLPVPFEKFFEQFLADEGTLYSVI
jgi:hypothetical protein